MASESIDLSELQTTLREQGARWQADVTPLTELSSAEQRLRLGATPPPGEPTLQEREEIARITAEATTPS